MAKKGIGNYEDALKWLGATSSMDDSFIVNMYGVKVSIASIFLYFILYPYQPSLTKIPPACY